MINTISLGDCIIYVFDELFNKYISNSSEYCINISSRMRKKLTKLFDKKSYEILKFKKEQQLQEQKLKQESSQQSQQSHESRPNISQKFQKSPQSQMVSNVNDNVTLQPSRIQSTLNHVTPTANTKNKNPTQNSSVKNTPIIKSLTTM